MPVPREHRENEFRLVQLPENDVMGLILQSALFLPLDGDGSPAQESGQSPLRQTVDAALLANLLGPEQAMAPTVLGIDSSQQVVIPLGVKDVLSANRADGDLAFDRHRVISHGVSLHPCLGPQLALAITVWAVPLHVEEGGNLIQGGQNLTLLQTMWSAIT